MANTTLFSSIKSKLPRTDTRNEVGGRAYKFSAKHALAQMAATGCFNGVYYASAQSQLDDVCRGDVCPKSKQSLQDDGKQYATLTTVGLGVGVVGIGVATVMLLSSGGSDEPAKEQSKKGVRVDVASTSSYTGVNLVGRF